MKILVCGGRKFADCELVWKTLDALQDKYGRLTIIQGGATGADFLAREWCYKQRLSHLVNVPADWETHGKAAGPIRNKEMLREKPDLVIAFAGGAGTTNMVQQAEKAGVKIEKIGW